MAKDFPLKITLPSTWKATLNEAGLPILQIDSIPGRKFGLTSRRGQMDPIVQSLIVQALNNKSQYSKENEEIFFRLLLADAYQSGLPVNETPDPYEQNDLVLAIFQFAQVPENRPFGKSLEDLRRGLIEIAKANDLDSSGWRERHWFRWDIDECIPTLKRLGVNLGPGKTTTKVRPWIITLDEETN